MHFLADNAVRIRILLYGLAMRCFMRRIPALFLAASLAFLLAAPAQAEDEGVAIIRRISVLQSRGDFELEIAGTEAVAPQTRVLTDPDRLVVDFLGAVPSRALHGMPIARGAVQSVRVGLFVNHPPVTRVVLNLSSPQRYEVFPSGRNVIVKILTSDAAVASSASSSPALRPVSTSASISQPPPSMPPGPPPPPASRLEVKFHSGILQIVAERTTLAAVLAEIHRRTGAEITVPPGAGGEQIFADLGPAPAREVLASLLDGSPFNFIVVGSARDPNILRSVVLTPRTPGGASAPSPASVQTTPEPTAVDISPPEPPAAEEPPPSSDQQPSEETSPETVPESMSPPPPQ